tara:strand:- start:802 stop:1224 length:423 start_codon:yes stop_codon:yes gene_type:complete
MIFLKEVNITSEEDALILFELLKKRKYFISHKSKIGYDKHLNFFKNHPYRKWFIVHLNEDILGAIYCTYQNSIGINLIIDDKKNYMNTIKKFISLISPLPPKPSIRSKYFSVNVSPQNKILQNALMELKAKQIQATFELT